MLTLEDLEHATIHGETGKEALAQADRRLAELLATKQAAEQKVTTLFAQLGQLVSPPPLCQPVAKSGRIVLVLEVEVHSIESCVPVAFDNAPTPSTAGHRFAPLCSYAVPVVLRSQIQIEDHQRGPYNRKFMPRNDRSDLGIVS